MAQFLTIAVPGDGEILVDYATALFDGDSSLVEPLRRLAATDMGAWKQSIDDEWVFAVWTGPGGARRALETVEPRFADEWRHLLPPDIADAPKPVFGPVDQVPPGIVY